MNNLSPEPHTCKHVDENVCHPMDAKGWMARDPLPPEIKHAAERGWRLLPVRAGSKIPLILQWQKVATNNLSQIEVWANQFLTCSWGVATGRASGLFVLDVDGQDGEDALLLLQREGGELSTKLTVSTARGRHLYFRAPQGLNIVTSAGKLGRGLDIRGEGAQVVIPPSLHSSGARYSYVDPCVDIADPPQWLVDLIAHPCRDGFSILHEGERNDGLTRLAGAWRRRGASQAELERRLLDENIRRCKPSLPQKEVLKIAANVALYPVGGP